jgi:hypothetical protein
VLQFSDGRRQAPHEASEPNLAPIGLQTEDGVGEILLGRSNQMKVAADSFFPNMAARFFCSKFIFQGCGIFLHCLGFVPCHI